MKKFVSWRRVSTKKQGSSGLGLSAQTDIIKHFVKSENGELIADFEEVYTGKDLRGCKELQKAMAFAKDNDATLIIAKTDRFRSTMEALQIYDQMGGNIFFCDLPHTDKFTLTLFFALAEREALLVSIRTKAALNVIKEKNVNGEAHTSKAGRTITHLGRPKNCESDPKAIKAMADARTEKARNNPFNIQFNKYLTMFENRCGKIKDAQAISAFVQELAQLDFRTATGLPFDIPRCWQMIYKARKLFA